MHYDKDILYSTTVKKVFTKLLMKYSYKRLYI